PSLCLEREHVVDRLAAADDAPLAVINHDLCWKRTAIVVRRHRRSVGASVTNGDEIADFEWHQHPIAADDVAALANRSHDFEVMSLTMTRKHRFDSMKRIVQSRPQQCRHARINHDEVARRSPRLDINHFRDQSGRWPDHRTTRFDDDWKTSGANLLDDRRHVV